MLANPRLVRVGVLCSLALLDSLGYTLLVNVLPVMTDESDPLHLNGMDGVSAGSAYSVLQFTFCLGVTVFPPFAGRFSDGIGRRPLLLWCLAAVAAAYCLQAITLSFWTFALLRLMCGISGCLRPLAIAYIADMAHDERTRCRWISSLSLASAFSVGLGPAVGAQLIGMDRRYPFAFMAAFATACFLLTYVLLPEVHKPHLLSPLHAPPPCGKSKRFMSIYRYLLALGFLTYFMAMTAAIAFPLSLKESFGMDPFTASLCSIVDGPLIFLSNLMFMQHLGSLSRASKASILAAAAFGLIALVPSTTNTGSLALFLLLKYSTSIAGPIIFSSIPQTMVSVCPLGSCGKVVGFLTFSHGAGRLTATALVGPLYSHNSAMVYDIVAWSGGVSALLFLFLLRRLESTIGVVELRTPLMVSGCEGTYPISRQMSLLYPDAPMGADFPISNADA